MVRNCNVRRVRRVRQNFPGKELQRFFYDFRIMRYSVVVKRSRVFRPIQGTYRAKFDLKRSFALDIVQLSHFHSVAATRNTSHLLVSPDTQHKLLAVMSMLPVHLASLLLFFAKDVIVNPLFITGNYSIQSWLLFASFKEFTSGYFPF